MHKSITDLKNSISKYHDIYCFFDRLTLGESLNIFIGLPNEEQDVIFQDFKNFNMHFGVDKTPDFINKVFTLVSVRNCVIHCNSLEILIRFYNPTTKTLRDRTNRKRFVSMIKYLSKEKRLHQIDVTFLPTNRSIYDIFYIIKKRLYKYLSLRI